MGGVGWDGARWGAWRGGGGGGAKPKHPVPPETLNNPMLFQPLNGPSHPSSSTGFSLGLRMVCGSFLRLGCFLSVGLVVYEV